MYAPTLASLGPSALRVVLDEAVSTGNKLLATALCARIGELPEKDRWIAAHQVATKFVGEPVARSATA
ncbi:MAG: hypothetical protein QM770_09470 [Tepidisphaeraceae bacterium]